MSFLGGDSDDEQWAPVSDLMAVIMLVFMLIAMILFVNFNLERLSNEKNCTETRDMLNSAFEKRFKEWGAVLEKDLTIRFISKRVLFKSGSSDIEDDSENGGWFAEMLRDFFPDYMKIIKEKIPSKFGNDEVLAIRIEGHTSSEYQNLGKEVAYIKNMELSQDRARKILQYVLSPQKISEANYYGETARRLITANGLSSSRLVCKNGEENKIESRRVEFKLLTNSCQKAGEYDKNPAVFLEDCSLKIHA